MTSTQSSKYLRRNLVIEICLFSYEIQFTADIDCTANCLANWVRNTGTPGPADDVRFLVYGLGLGWVSKGFGHRENGVAEIGWLRICSCQLPWYRWHTSNWTPMILSVHSDRLSVHPWETPHNHTLQPAIDVMSNFIIRLSIHDPPPNNTLLYCVIYLLP